MAEKKNFQCILVQMPDGRQFFTNKNNYNQLIEFIKTFSAEVYIVKVDKANILDLDEFAKEICKTNPTKPVNFKIIGRCKPKKVGMAKEVRTFIREKFLMGHSVRLGTLAKHYNTSSQYISNHMGKIRKELAEKGHKIIKIAPGNYMLTKKSKPKKTRKKKKEE